MSSIRELQAINEVWEDRVRRQSRAEGRQEGLRVALMAVYEARFGALPPALQGGIEAATGEKMLRQWVRMFTTQTHAEIEAAVLPEGAPIDAA